jgi:hypothetical protein
LNKIHPKKSDPRLITVFQALLAAVVVAGGALLLVNQRAPQFEAHISLIAAPAFLPAPGPEGATKAPAPQGATGVPAPAGAAQEPRAINGGHEFSGADFASVVSLGFPALSPLAHTPTVLSAAHAQVPGSPPADELSSLVTVELVPASAVARISVRADSAEIAIGLARAIVNQLVQSNLLAPVAVLRPLDEQPVVAQTQPDWALGLGWALAAGAVAAVAVVSLRALLWPDTGQRVTRALTAAGVEHDVSAFGLGDGDLYDRICLLARAADTPVRVLYTEPDLQDDVDKLTAGLDERGIALADERDGGGPTACLCVLRSSRDMGMLSATVSALPDDYRLMGVIVK